MNYIIYSKSISNYFEEPIDEKLYDQLMQSKEILSEARSKENIYNIILMNYYEFEKELFKVLLKNELFSSNYNSFNDYISKIEQRIINLLSSITLYLDSFKNDLDEKYSSYLESEFEVIRQYLKSSRNNKIEIMQFLRNHIQHNGLLIDAFLLKGVNLSPALREQTLKFHIKKDKIKARNFNIDNFISIENDIDLKIFIREYVDYISKIHQQFRDITDKKIQFARNSYEEILNNYSEYKSICVAKKINEDRIDEIPILLNWDDIRLEMIQKNRVPTCFYRHSINTK